MKKFVYSIVFLFITSLSANAYIDSQFSTSEQYLLNTGYSKEAARILQMQKKDVYAPVEKQVDKRSPYEKFYNYIDPVSGGNADFPHHNINFQKSNPGDL